MKYLGIDGCRAGWVVATIQDRQLAIEVIDSLQALGHIKAAKAYIDIPLHFARQQYRTCEIEARRLLGRPKMASVFLTPHREAVYAATFAEANRINKAITGKGVSVQAWNIFGKIKEAVAFAEANENVLLQEAHPELCFWFLNNRAPLLSKKSTSAGIADRTSIIANASEKYRTIIADALTSTKRKDVKPDDVLDAVVLAIRAASSSPQAVLAGSEKPAEGNIFF